MGNSTVLLRSAPYLPVTDVRSALEYYEGVLGFTPEYVGGAPPEFAIVSRDGLGIMLRLVPGPLTGRPNESWNGTWDVFFWVSGIDELARELGETGAQIVYGPVNQDLYGMRELAVRDPSGYVLGFGEPLEGG